LKIAFPFLLGYLLDLILGDPPQWPHPIRLLGLICQYWEKTFYAQAVMAGGLYWLAVMGSTLVLIIAALVVAVLLPSLFGVAVLAYLIYAGLATRSLHRESARVMEALVKGDLDAARANLSMIVGRETGRLDPEEIRRAVLETVAENLADAVVAPMFFLLLLGVPGLFLYKAANTMDSMVGYKNYRYGKFGRVAARLDDVLNFLPARLTAVLMVAAAALTGLDRRGSWRILRRDAGKAASPNAGWPEAALAGALSVRLGGPSTYFGRVVDKPFIGEAPPHPLNPSHYRGAVRLLYATSLLMAGITLLGLKLTSAGIWGIIARFF
jgi:adenosylcobinamide-phosphate synthase